MSKTIFKIIILLCIFRLPVMAAGKDSLYLENSMNIPDKTFFEKIYNNSSSTHFRPDAFSHGDVGIHYNYSDFDKLSFIQDGSSLNQYKLAADGVVVKQNNIFWGNISYTNFRRKNVRWNNVYDHNRVGPYLLADSIGGNVRGEEYNLAGGISVKYNKWIFGGKAGYIAGQNYRKTDPRPQATSTDIYIQASASYNIINNYQAGLSFNAGKYREDIKISVEQDKASYDFFPLKGFGLFDYTVFKAQASSYSTAYDGQNYGGVLFFIPQNKNGFLGNFKFDYNFIEPNYGSDNSPTLYTYRTYDTSIDLGWQNYKNNYRSFIKFSYDYKLGKGTERIYYKLQSEDQQTPIVKYYLLSSNSFYTKKIIESKLSGGHEWFSAKNVKWIIADISYRTYEERYAHLQYKMNFERLITSLQLGGEFHLNQTSAIIPKIGVTYSPSLHSKKELPVNKIFTLSGLPNISYMEADLKAINGSFTYQHKLKSFVSLYSSLYANYLTDKNNNRYTIGLSVGLKY